VGPHKFFDNFFVKVGIAGKMPLAMMGYEQPLCVERGGVEQPLGVRKEKSA
jgi:hypothetical protein